MGCKTPTSRRWLGMRVLLGALLLFGTSQLAAQPYAYVSNLSGNSVSVIDTATNTVVTTIAVGLEPFGVAVSPDGSLVYVSNRVSETISVIATSTNTVVSTIVTGRVSGMAFTPDGSTVYAARQNANNVAVINVASGLVTGSIPVGNQPYSVAVTPDGSRVFVSNIFGSGLSVISTAINTVTHTVPTAANPSGLAMSPDGSRVYVANAPLGNVLAFDTTTLALVASIPVSARVFNIAISPDGLTAYATAHGAAVAWKLNLVAGTWIGTVTTPSIPRGANYHPDGQTVYITNFDAGSVSVVNVAANTIVANVGVGAQPVAHGVFISQGAAQVIPTGVELDASPSAPLTYGNEIIASSTSPLTLANPDGDLNLSAPLGYSFSAGEVRYARFECDSGLRFNAGSTALYDGAGNASIGAINGLGTGAIHFSVTANNAAVRADHRLVITGQRNITSSNDVDCRYSLYDFPSQAAVGGVAGRVTTVSGPYLRFAPSYVVQVDSEGSPVANVESNPAYSAFVVQPPTSSSVLAQIGGFSHGTRLAVTGEPQPLNAAGVPITLANVLAADTKLVFKGDFSAADEVFLSTSAACAVATLAANDFNATGASFTTGSAPQLARFLCVEADGNPIPASAYTVALQASPATPALYAVSDQGPLALGEVTRNGTQLQAPLAQVPANYQSRLVLTNSGLIPRTYAARILQEAGSSSTPGKVVTGTIPPLSMIVVDMADAFGTITAGASRGTVDVTIAAPNHQIQGLYQIVNSNTGAISNHTMVRPGSN